MKGLGFATVIVGVLVAVLLGPAAPAVAAPSGPPTALEAMNSLEADGYTVILKQVGDAPLDQCSVSQLGPEHTHSGSNPNSPAVCMHVTCGRR